MQPLCRQGRGEAEEHVCKSGSRQPCQYDGSTNIAAMSTPILVKVCLGVMQNDTQTGNQGCRGRVLFPNSGRAGLRLTALAMHVQTLEIRCASLVEQVLNRQDGMTGEHAGTRVSHALADLLAFLGVITVDRAIGAGGLLSAPGTFFNALEGIFHEVLAISTETLAMPMQIAAIKAYHGRQRLSLANLPPR